MFRQLESAPVTAVGYAPIGGKLGWATWRLNVISPEEVNATGLLKVGDVTGGKGKLEGKLLGDHRDVIRGLAFSPDGTKVATAEADGTVTLWSLADGEKLWTLRAHHGGAVGVAFSPDGQRLASGGADKVVRVWDVTTGNEVLTLTGHVNEITSLAFSSDGRSLAAGSYSGEIRVWLTKR
jgi:WD40 repeat protein